MNFMQWKEVEQKRTPKQGQLAPKTVETTWSQSGSTWGLGFGRTGTQMSPPHQLQGDSVVKP